MTRQARPKRQQRFDLYIDNPDENDLHLYLAGLALVGRQREFVVSALVAAMKRKTKRLSK